MQASCSLCVVFYGQCPRIWCQNLNGPLFSCHVWFEIDGGHSAATTSVYFGKQKFRKSYSINSVKRLDICLLPPLVLLFLHPQLLSILQLKLVNNINCFRWYIFWKLILLPFILYHKGYEIMLIYSGWLWLELCLVFWTLWNHNRMHTQPTCYFLYYVFQSGY